MWISEEVKAHLSPFFIHFNNIDLTDYVIPISDTGRGLSQREVLTRTTPGRAGGMILSKRTPIRYLSINVLMACDDAAELHSMLEQLSAILHTDAPAPLTFSDEPDRIYHATYSGADEGYWVDGFHQTSINFVCVDPHKHSEKQSTIVNSSGIAVIQNNSTADTPPEFRIAVKQPITTLDIFSENGYMRLGKPAPIDQTPISPMDRVFWTEANTLVGWAVGTNPEDGDISGALKTNGESFYTNEYGTGPRWHGPAMKTSMSQSIQDFRMDVELQMDSNSIRQVGGIEVALKDETDNYIAKISFKKNFPNETAFYPQIRAGRAASGHSILAETSANAIVKNKFFGLLRVQRVGKMWTAEIFESATLHGVKKLLNRFTWQDDAGIATNAVRQVQVQLKQWTTYDTPLQRVDDIKVFRLNNVDVNKIPNIAGDGDIIVIDGKKRVILLNDEVRMDLIGDFGSSFFPLKPGENIISTVTPSVAAIEVIHDNLYL